MSSHLLRILSSSHGERMIALDQAHALVAEPGAVYSLLDGVSLQLLEHLKLRQEGDKLIVELEDEVVATIDGFYAEGQQVSFDLGAGSAVQTIASSDATISSSNMVWEAATDLGTAAAEAGASVLPYLAGVAVVGGVTMMAMNDANNHATPVAAAPDTVAPVIQTITAQGTTAVLTYNEALDAVNVPAAGAFSVMVGGVANPVTNVAVAGMTVTLTLTNAVATGAAVTISYTDPTAGNDANAIQDAAGNDALGFSSGVVADGYISGAQIYIDVNNNGIAEVGELQAGVLTDANGMFILQAGAPVGAILAVGGTNIDTGLPNTLVLKAPAGSTTVNPLTTVLQDYMAANPGATATQADTAVQTALGITLPAGSTLSDYDPLAAGNLSVQQVAVQVAEIANQAESATAGSGSTVFTNIANAVNTANTNTTPLNFTTSADVNTATSGVAGVDVTAITTQATAIANATTITAISTLQKAPIVRLTTDSGTAGDLITNDGALTVTTKVAGSTVQYSVDSGTSWSASFNAVEGANSVQVREVNTAGKAVSGVTTFDFTLRTVDITAPTATATVETIANTASTDVQSSETGTAYLVNSNITVNSLADITTAVDALWNKVAITSANTATALPATGLAAGTYNVYSEDAAGNLSSASTGSVTVTGAVTVVFDLTIAGAGAVTASDGSTAFSTGVDYNIVVKIEGSNTVDSVAAATTFTGGANLAAGDTVSLVAADGTSSSIIAVNGNAAAKYLGINSAALLRASPGTFRSHNAGFITNSGGIGEYTAGVNAPKAFADIWTGIANFTAIRASSGYIFV